MNTNSLFAKKLSYLLKQVRKPDGSRYTRDEVAHGVGVTPTYVSKLKGGKANPSYELVRKFAEFFNVRPGYFYNEDEELTPADVEIDADSPLMGEIALRAAQLDDAEREAVLEMMKHIARLRQTRGDK